jgi:hypothetical protein
MDEWTEGELTIASPMILHEPTRYFCYFCLEKFQVFSKSSKNKIEYPNIPSVIKPLLHGEDLPTPVSPAN